MTYSKSNLCQPIFCVNLWIEFSKSSNSLYFVFDNFWWKCISNFNRIIHYYREKLYPCKWNQKFMRSRHQPTSKMLEFNSSVTFTITYAWKEKLVYNITEYSKIINSYGNKFTMNKIDIMSWFYFSKSISDVIGMWMFHHIPLHSIRYDSILHS